MTRVGYQGAPGAFGEAAALALWPHASPVPFLTFSEVVEAIEAGAVERAVLPVANRIVGPVAEAVTALERVVVARVVRSIELPVRFHLMAPAGASLTSVRRVAGQPVALAQCRRFLATLSVTIDDWYDSAAAARELAQTQDRTRAVIAGQAAADRYRLVVLSRDVHDDPSNATRFVGLSRV